MGDITAANAVLMLSIPLLFPVPQQLQGFATDDIYDLDEIQRIETQMGVDGVLSGGFVFKEQPQSITLQADSPSNSIFDVWDTQSQAAQTAYLANGIIILPAIGLKFIQTNGFLTTWKAPGAKKTLQPRRYRITWGSCLPARV